MDYWYNVAIPRKEVREGRSFNPDEFAIHLEQIIAKKAPEDYRNPKQFFERTCFTRALREHAGMVLRRLSGQTTNTAPVMTLVTQFGGGKTHTLTALYHLVTNASEAGGFRGVQDLVQEAGIQSIPGAKVAAFVGNAWDPQEGRETPWLDIARQLAGDKGVKELGPAARTKPPGTEALIRVFSAANAPVLLLFDEVLNFLNRHRDMADHFHSFIQNLTVATTGTTHGAAVISLPRSQVEMTDWDMTWQDKITKVVRRVAKDLIANDETEISEVVRRRLFEEIGNEKVIKKISKEYADWCFERRERLPREWTAIDSAATEAKAKEYLRKRFETCYPFHPATLSVFQRKWQALSQYQQTRGTLAMLAQWISWAYRTGFTEARRELLITLGSAPLGVQEFRSVALGQLGESRLQAAIDADISGEQSHAKTLDADTRGTLRHIHERLGITIFFESSGGQIDKVAHLPELRFALGEKGIDTTSIDNAALALEDKSYFIKKVGTDGFKISHQPTMKKVVNDRRASLDDEKETIPAMQMMVKKEFERGASIPLVFFPSDGASIQDTPRLTLVIADPETEWTGTGSIREEVTSWMKQRGKSPRLYPGSLVWCFKKPGRDFRDKVELWLAWKRVEKEITEGTLGGEFDRTERADIHTKVKDAEESVKDEVWAGYRFVILLDNNDETGLKAIDLGAGHASGGETLCGRVITALKSQALLNEAVGSSYIERNWPPALKESGAWPLASLRQSFLNGSLTRLPDTDRILRDKIVEFVSKGEFGLASGKNAEGGYDRVWFKENISKDEVTFESNVFLLLKKKAEALVKQPEPQPTEETTPPPPTKPEPPTEPEPPTSTEPELSSRTFRISGNIPPEIWNRLGTKILPKLRSGSDLEVGINFTVTIEPDLASNFETELKQILDDLGIGNKVSVT